jgi:hypothetical protein
LIYRHWQVIQVRSEIFLYPKIFARLGYVTEDERLKEHLQTENL